MTSKKKEPLALILHVEHSDVKAQAMIVPATYFDLSAAENGKDTTMIWCAGLLPGRSSIPEAETMRRALPANCSVNYFQPNHDENPTRIDLVNDNGIDEGYDGQWTCVLTAPRLDSLGQTFDCFAEHYMGLGAPMRDNFFRWEMSTHKFLSRRNNVGGKTWETRFTMTLQMKGSVTLPFGQFATRMQQRHGWLQWSGNFLSDPLKLLGNTLWASCKTDKEVDLRWKQFQEAKCKGTHAPVTPGRGVQGCKPNVEALSPMSLPSPTPQVSVSTSSKEPPGPLTVWPTHWHKPVATLPGLNKWPDKIPDKIQSIGDVNVTESMDRVPIDKKDGSVQYAADYISKKQPANEEEVKNIKDVMPLDKKQQCVSQSTHQPIMTTDVVAPTQLDIEEGADSMEPHAKKKKSDSNTDADEGELSMDEYTSLVRVFQSALEVVKTHFHTLCTSLIKDKKIDKLQHFTTYIESIDSFVGCPIQDFDFANSRRAAHEIVPTLIQLFAEYEELQEAGLHLQQWQTEILQKDNQSVMPNDVIGTVLKSLLQVWEKGWEDKKQKMLMDEDYTALSHMKSTKDKLAAWVSQKDPPMEHELWNEFKQLDAIPAFQEFRVLTAEELLNAGLRQQHWHFLYGMTVELPSNEPNGASTVE